MQILHQHHQRAARRLRHEQPTQRPERAVPDGLRVEVGELLLGVCHAERVPQVVRQRHVELESLDPQLDLDRHQVGGIVGDDPAGVADQPEQRQIRDAGSIGQAAAHDHGRAILRRPAEFQRQPRLAQARVSDQADRLALAVSGYVECAPQLSQLMVPAGERAQLIPTRDPLCPATQAHNPQRMHGSLFDLDRRDLLQPEIAAYQSGRPLAHHHRAWRRGGLQPGRQDRGVTERRVVHPEVVTDFPHDDQAAVDPDSDLQLRPRSDAQRRQHRTPGVVLVRDRGPEQRHKPVAEKLVDRALVPVHLGQPHTEEAVDGQVVLLGPQFCRQGS